MKAQLRVSAGPKGKLRCSAGMSPSKTRQSPFPDLPPRRICAVAFAGQPQLVKGCRLGNAEREVYPGAGRHPTNPLGRGIFCFGRFWCANASTAGAAGAAAAPAMPRRCFPIQHGNQELREGDIPRRGHSKALHGRRKPSQVSQTNSRSYPQIFSRAPKPLERRRNVPPAPTEFLWFYVLKSFF